MAVKARYLWIDGGAQERLGDPTKKLRGKTKVLLDRERVQELADLPTWKFDGSSTNQATTDRSDVLLQPAHIFPDPTRGEPHVIVLSEVMQVDGTPHPTNTRVRLREAAETYASDEPWAGVEQEYTLFKGGRPLGWPSENGFPPPQGGYYCGVGCDEVFGEELVEEHTDACVAAGLKICGTNAEVMPAQWEYQLGPLPPLELADQSWVARFLLYQLGRKYGVYAKLHPKPIDGDWNGAGGHMNFSTKAMRTPGGLRSIIAACEKLEKFHKEHIAVYGAFNAARLTGRHETCGIDTFRWGVADRGASIRIPADIYRNECGFLEDRRPAANADPYEVLTALLETVCGKGFKH